MPHFIRSLLLFKTFLKCGGQLLMACEWNFNLFSILFCDYTVDTRIPLQT